MQQPLKISNGYFQLWQAYLQQRHIHYPLLGFSVERCAVIAELLAQPIDQLSSYALFSELIEQTQQALKVQNLALEMARCIGPAHFGLLGYMASKSENIAQALDYVVRFNRLVVDGAQISSMQFQHEHAQIRMFCKLDDPKHIFLHELSLAAMLHLAKQLLSENHYLPLLQISFAHPAQMPLFFYQDFYRCPIKFEQAQYEIIFSDQLLGLAPTQPDPNLIQILLKQAEEALAQRPEQGQMIDQLHFIVAQYLRLKQQAPKITDIAPVLFLSVRTLQRQLRAQGRSYKQILEHERMLLCEEMLLRQQSLTEIALALGYSDQSALARAYKAATGQTLLQRKYQRS